MPSRKRQPKPAPPQQRAVAVTKQAARSDVVSLGSSSSLDRLMNRFSWVGDADEVLIRAGITRAKLRALMDDDEIYAAMETRRDAALNVPWRFECKNEADAKFYSDAFRPVMQDILRNAWQAVPFGYSVCEVVYRPMDDPTSTTPGRIGLDKIIAPPFEWFLLQPDGSMKWVFVDPIDTRKFFPTVREPSLRKPMGESLLSRLYWPWFFRTHGWKFWLKFMERCAIPFVVGKTSTDKQEALTALTAAVQDAVVVMGTDDELTALDMGAAKVDFNQFEEAVVRRYQRLILGQTLTTGTDGGSGNRALGNVHNEVRLEKKEADCRLVASTVQKIADMLAAMNGIEPGRFVMEDGTGLEMDRATRDKTLVDAGILKFTPEYIADKYGLDASDFTVPDQAPTPTKGQPVSQKAAALAAARFADGDKPARVQFTQGQQIVEDAISAALPSLKAGPIDEAAIKGAIRAAADPDDLVHRLSIVLRDASRDQFEQVLERALFAADVMGYAHAGASA
jgi:phage gp29-like protein